MDRQRKGIGVTGDEKKNHLCNYKFFWSGYLQQVWHGRHLAVKLAERKKKKKKKENRWNVILTHTHTHSWILNIYKLLGTALETCTSRCQFGWKPGIGRKDKCFFLLLQASLFWDITTRKHQSTEPCWLDTAPDQVGSSQVSSWKEPLPVELLYVLHSAFSCQLSAPIWQLFLPLTVNLSFPLPVNTYGPHSFINSLNQCVFHF